MLDADVIHTTVHRIDGSVSCDPSALKIERRPRRDLLPLLRPDCEYAFVGG